MKILGIGNAIVDVICKVDENFLVKKASSTLQITSTIAFPIPKIFILSFFCFNWFLSIRITSGTDFTS